MWTVIWWNRELNEWYEMRGFTEESQALERLRTYSETVCSNMILSLNGPDGEIVWAEFGSHPSIGYCHSPSVCWCGDSEPNKDHTLVEGSSNT